MKKIITPFLLILIFGLFACRPHHSHEGSDVVAEQESLPISPTSWSSLSLPGETVVPTLEGKLIKVNNQLCAVSRTPMTKEMVGKFVGQVAYQGSHPKYQGKVFEFNYCCGMCQKSFPDQFKKDPDGILKFHGLL